MLHCEKRLEPIGRGWLNSTQVSDQAIKPSVKTIRIRSLPICQSHCTFSSSLCSIMALKNRNTGETGEKNTHKNVNKRQTATALKPRQHASFWQKADLSNNRKEWQIQPAGEKSGQSPLNSPRDFFLSHCWSFSRLTNNDRSCNPPTHN